MPASARPSATASVPDQWANGAVSVALAGAASVAVRGLLTGSPRRAKVIAVFPAAAYLEVADAEEPKVIAMLATDATRPPNGVVVAAPAKNRPFGDLVQGQAAIIGEYGVLGGLTRRDGCALRVRIRRWWDPVPVLGPLSRKRLAAGERALREACETATLGLRDHPAPAELARGCEQGSLVAAVEAAEQLVGLGPGLTPSGDDILCGIMLALRLLGGAVVGGGPAVRLADWIGAAVTHDAAARTTAVSATLLHCASHGQAGVQVAGVLAAIAGAEPMEGPLQRLLSIGHTSGADLAFGLTAGCRAALLLSGGRAG